MPEAAASLSAAGHPVYAYDQLGAGRSARLADVTGYTVARHVADLEAIRVVLGADRIVLIGQSWGASLAAQYLAAHPQRVAAVVFTSPGPIWPGAHPDGGIGDPWQRMTPAQRAARDALVARPRVLAQALLQQVNPDAAHAFVGDDEADELMHRIAALGKDGTGCPDSPPAAVHGNHQGFYVNQLTVDDFARVADPRPALRDVRVPALIVRGDCDFVPAATAEEYRRTLPGAILVNVPGAGHAVARNQPDRYRDLVTGFLEETP
ncbi:alpha/beta fold hydrolase [Dactylosporangium cerinum]